MFSFAGLKVSISAGSVHKIDEGVCVQVRCPLSVFPVGNGFLVVEVPVGKPDEFAVSLHKIFCHDEKRIELDPMTLTIVPFYGSFGTIGSSEITLMETSTQPEREVQTQSLCMSTLKVGWKLTVCCGAQCLKQICNPLFRFACSANVEASGRHDLSSTMLRSVVELRPFDKPSLRDAPVLSRSQLRVTDQEGYLFGAGLLAASFGLTRRVSEFDTRRETFGRRQCGVGRPSHKPELVISPHVL